MADIVEFKKHEAPEEPEGEVIFVCKCGNTTFTLSDTQQCPVCAHCGSPVDTGQNGIFMVQRDMFAPLVDKAGTKTVVDFNDGFGLKSFIKTLDDVKPSIIVALCEGGDMYTFGPPIDTRQRKAWLRRALNNARRVLQRE